MNWRERDYLEWKLTELVKLRNDARRAMLRTRDRWERSDDPMAATQVYRLTQDADELLSLIEPLEQLLPQLKYTDISRILRTMHYAKVPNMTNVQAPEDRYANA